MCDASEVGEGALDTLPQLLCPAETPGHSGHVLVHGGEPWGHGTGRLKEARPRPHSAQEYPPPPYFLPQYLHLLKSPCAHTEMGVGPGRSACRLRSKEEGPGGEHQMGSEDRGAQPSAAPHWLSDSTPGTFHLPAHQHHLGALKKIPGHLGGSVG